MTPTCCVDAINGRNIGPVDIKLYQLSPGVALGLPSILAEQSKN